MELAEVRGAAVELVEATREARGLVDAWQAEPVTAIERALAAIADVPDGVDLAADSSPAPGGRDVSRPWTPLPRGASPRDRVYDLYDACLDFLGAFLDGHHRHADPVQRWLVAGRELRRVLILEPERRGPAPRLAPLARRRPGPLR